MKTIFEMKTLTSLLSLLFILLQSQNTYSISLETNNQNLSSRNSISVLPVPNKVKIGDGTFVVNKTTKIFVDSSSKSNGEFLANQLFRSSGFKLKVELIKKTTTVQNAISITTINSKKDLGDEGYEMIVTATGVSISALTKSGGYYGVQTLLQLLPTEVYSTQPIAGVAWTIPCVQIEDKPRFKWRGMMLDMSRHFFTKTEVMKVIDGMTINKLNTLQMHLVDADGWRIEIKRYPKLTEVGAWRDGISFGLDPESSTAYRADGKYGGFYTQDDIRELVSYAAERHINIVPEIEMPAHCSSAILSYPELKCTTQIQNPNVWEWPYCAGEDNVFEFLNNVLTEVAALFPSKYIHIGGDEVVYTDWKNCPKCQSRIKSEGLNDEKELQSYFIGRIEKSVNALGKTMIGWSEIMEGGIAQNAVLMDWIGGAEHVAVAGHDVVMTPHKYCYFDHRQTAEIQSEPKAHPRFLPLSRVYDFEPIPAKLDPVYSKHILGAQGNLWTEYIPNLKHLEYMAYPRLSALAEVTWSLKETKDWSDFNRRLQTQFLRLDQLGINYRRETAIEIGGWTPKELYSGNPLVWEMPQLNEVGNYRVSFDFVRGDNKIKIEWVALFEDGIELTRDNHTGIVGYELHNDLQSNSTFVLKFPLFKVGSKYSLQALVKGEGGNDSQGKVNIQFTQTNSKHIE